MFVFLPAPDGVEFTAWDSTNDIFLSKRKKSAMRKKKKELKTYKNSHGIISIKSLMGVPIIETELITEEKLCEILLLQLTKKNNYLKNKNNIKNISLFVHCSEEIQSINLINLTINQLKNNHYKTIYIGCLHKNDYYVFEYENGRKLKTYHNLRLDCQTLGKIAIDRGWN